MTKILFILVVTFATSCNSKIVDSKVYSPFCKDSVIQTTLKKILDNPKSYNGKYVCITGKYFNTSEQSSIGEHVTAKDYRQIWIELSDSNILEYSANHFIFLSSNDIVDRIKNRKVKLVGLYKAGSSGHLGGYSGNISNVCVLKLEN